MQFGDDHNVQEVAKMRSDHVFVVFWAYVRMLIPINGVNFGRSEIVFDVM